MVKPTLNQESSCNANNHPTPPFVFFLSIASYVGLPCKEEPTPAGTDGQVSLLTHGLIYHRLKLCPLTLVLGCQLYILPMEPGQTCKGQDKETEKGCREQRWWRPH